MADKLWDQLSHIHTFGAASTRISSTVLSSQGAGRVFPSTAVGEEHGQLSCSEELGVRYPACHRWQGMGERGTSVPCPCHHMPEKWWGQLSLTHVLGTSLLMLPPPGPTLLCGPNEVQGLLLWMLKLVRGRSSSPALMNPRPILSPAADAERQGGSRVSLPHPCHCKRDEGPGQISCAHTLSLATPTTKASSAVLPR